MNRPPLYDADELVECSECDAIHSEQTCRSEGWEILSDMWHCPACAEECHADDDRTCDEDDEG
jgi:hypothetical protein